MSVLLLAKHFRRKTAVVLLYFLTSTNIDFIIDKWISCKTNCTLVHNLAEIQLNLFNFKFEFHVNAGCKMQKLI